MLVILPLSSPSHSLALVCLIKAKYFINKVRVFHHLTKLISLFLPLVSRIHCWEKNKPKNRRNYMKPPTPHWYEWLSSDCWGHSFTCSFRCSSSESSRNNGFELQQPSYSLLQCRWRISQSFIQLHGEFSLLTWHYAPDLCNLFIAFLLRGLWQRQRLFNIFPTEETPFNYQYISDESLWVSLFACLRDTDHEIVL